MRIICVVGYIIRMIFAAKESEPPASSWDVGTYARQIENTTLTKTVRQLSENESGL